MKLKVMVKSILFSYAMHILLYIIYAFLLANTRVAESTIPTCSIIIGLLCVFEASMMATRKMKKNGLQNGAIIGFLYVLLVYFLGSVFNHEFVFSFHSLYTICFYVFVGMFGGMIGVNFA